MTSYEPGFRHPGIESRLVHDDPAAAAAFAVHQRVIEACQVLIDYEYAAQRYLRMKEPSISWSSHADKLATRLRALLGSIEECERVVSEVSGG